MDNFTFLTISQLKEMTAISKNVDVSYLEPFIQTSEEMHVLPILGTALTSELQGEIEAGTISGSNETLWVQYINPCSAWYSFFECSPFIHTKAFNKGLVHQFSNNSNSIDFDTFKNYKQSIKDKSTFYRNRLIEYLSDNAELYPNWRVDTNDCDQYTKKQWSGGIYLK